MTWIGRAAAIGAGFGLAAAAIEMGLFFVTVMAVRMGPGPVTLAQNALLTIALGALLGLSGGIILRSQRRAAPFLHLAWLCGAWLLVERWIWVDVPMLALLSLARSLGAGAFVLVVLLLERSGRRFA
ncbi:MAG: hypothetical protein ACREI7_02740, partial [Myxococcota bacterium]